MRLRVWMGSPVRGSDTRQHRHESQVEACAGSKQGSWVSRQRAEWASYCIFGVSQLPCCCSPECRLRGQVVWQCWLLRRLWRSGDYKQGDWVSRRWAGEEVAGRERFLERRCRPTRAPLPWASCRTVLASAQRPTISSGCSTRSVATRGGMIRGAVDTSCSNLFPLAKGHWNSLRVRLKLKTDSAPSAFRVRIFLGVVFIALIDSCRLYFGAKRSS